MRKLLLTLLLIGGLSAAAFAEDIQQNSSSFPLKFFCKDSAGAAITGLSPTVTINKNGGSFGSPAGAVSEVANGMYKVAGNATDTNTLGAIWLKAVCSGGVTFLFPVANIVDVPTLQDVIDGVLDELLSAHTVAGTPGKALADIDAHTDTEVAAIKTVTDSLATLVIRSNTAQTGTSTTITLDSSASATSDLYKGALVLITSGTGAGQFRQIISYAGSTKIATVDKAWITNPTNSSVFLLVTP